VGFLLSFLSDGVGWSLRIKQGRGVLQEYSAEAGREFACAEDFWGTKEG
jgi:hypothetical protein